MKQYKRLFLHGRKTPCVSAQDVFGIAIKWFPYPRRIGSIFTWQVFHRKRQLYSIASGRILRAVPRNTVEVIAGPHAARGFWYEIIAD